MPEKSWMFPYKESFNASMVTKLPWARLGYDMFIFHRLQILLRPLILQTYVFQCLELQRAQQDYSQRHPRHASEGPSYML